MKMGKKVVSIMICLGLLFAVCATDEGENLGTISDGSIPVVSENTVENNMSSENIIRDYSCSTKLNDYKITNLLESFAAFGIPDDFSREITVGDYSNKYPVVLQDILLHYNDDNLGEDDDWQEYEADCREVTSEDIGDALYTELVEALHAAYAPGNVDSTIHALDIDKDGDDEYVLYTTESDWNHALFILKCVDGQWVVINGGGDSRRPARILNYENNYYFLLDSRLAYWNDEAEMPGLSYWNNEDVVLGQDECWNELSLRRHVTGYTPYEIYSNAPDSSIDFLEEVDLETLTVNHAEEKDFDGVIQTYGNSAHSFRFFGGWQISYEGVNYLYAAGHISNQQDVLGESDRALFVMRENEDGSWEVVKVYYMGANYDLQFEELDSQTSVAVAPEVVFIPWEEAGLEDHVMDWQDENLEAAMREVTGIADGDIMLSDVWEITVLELSEKEIVSIDALGELRNLQTLDLDHNAIRNIECLSELSNLQYLDLYHNQIRDISALSSLTNLNNLELGKNQLENISELSTLTNLEYFYLQNCQIYDISALGNLTQLKELSLALNEISDISALGGLTELYRLNVAANQIEDISVLGGLTGIQSLSLSNNHITDVSALQGLRELKYLDLGYNKISDISSLCELTELEYLDLTWNSIHDIEALRSMTKLQTLNLLLNYVDDVSALSGLTSLEWLNVMNNEISDLSPLSGLYNLQVIYPYGNYCNDYSPISFVPEIRTSVFAGD